MARNGKHERPVPTRTNGATPFRAIGAHGVAPDDEDLRRAYREKQRTKQPSTTWRERKPIAIAATLITASACLAAAVFALAAFEPAPEPTVESTAPVAIDGAAAEANDTPASAKHMMEVAPFEPSPQALDQVESSTEIEGFSLTGGNTPMLPNDISSRIREAIDAVSERGDMGLVFYSLETGNGIAYNADQAVYGASSFKGPYALYVCEQLIETGRATLDTPGGVPGIFDSGSYRYEGPSTTSDLMEAMIIYSDNYAFGSLRAAYDDPGFDEWAAQLGAIDTLCDPSSWYPWYCARSSAKLWTEMYLYLQTNTETSCYLGELLSQTELSFIRNAVDDADTLVLNKAGWCADENPLWNGLCDAGIVIIDGHPFVLSIMTSMPDSETNREPITDVARAALDACDTLLA